MKRLLLAAGLLLLWPMVSLHAHAFSYADIQAEYAVLMDADTGQVLFDKNMNQRAYPASMTKIMTGLLAVEQGSTSQMIMVTETAVNIEEPASSHIALTPGEQLPLHEALYALLLPSANDAANVIAEHVAGTQEAFAKQMTEKARAIGAVDTSFVNPHGLHDDNHYTTAYDMALITRYAAQNDVFMDYFGTGTHTMPPTNKQSEERPFTNYQYMLVENTRFYNPDVIGGKIGYTNAARHTMATVARRDGRTLICVVMSTDRDQKFYDTQLLLDFGFEEFAAASFSRQAVEEQIRPLQADGSQVGTVTVSMAKDLLFLLHDSIDPGTVTFQLDTPDFYTKGEAIAPVGLLQTQAKTPRGVPALLLTQPLTVTIDDGDGVHQPEATGESLNLGRVLFISLAVLAAGFAGLLLLRWYNLHRRRQMRLARLNRRMAAQDAQLRPREPAHRR